MRMHVKTVIENVKNKMHNTTKAIGLGRAQNLARCLCNYEKAQLLSIKRAFQEKRHFLRRLITSSYRNFKVAPHNSQVT